MPEPLDTALAALRGHLLDLDALVRAVASGRRRGAPPPAHLRAELRPVRIKSGEHLQVVVTDGVIPRTSNHARGPDAAAAVDALLAEPFGNWHVETERAVVQLRVTKRGEAQVHTAERSGGPPSGPGDHDRVKDHLLGADDPLFTVLGTGGDKRRQVDAFLRQLVAVLDPALDAAHRAGRPLQVVDLGCGNAYLTFAAHRYLSAVRSLPVRTVGVDQRADLVRRNLVAAQRLELDGLDFVTGSIAEAEPFGASVEAVGEVDLVLALHACDTATDDALARAARWQAPVVLAAPCCHHHVQRQLERRRREGVEPPEPYRPLVREPILRQRFADVLTDAMRAELMRRVGYRVDVVEFIDSRHTPRNALLRMVRQVETDHEVGSDGAFDGGDLAGLTTAWQVRLYLMDVLGDLLPAGPA